MTNSPDERRILGVVNYEAISHYTKVGFTPAYLETYYNPADYFDEVHIFAYGDTEWRLSEKVRVHPLKRGFKVAELLQLVRYCRRYKVNVLRDFEAHNDIHVLAAVAKRMRGIPGIISLHDVYCPPTILLYEHVFAYVEWLRENITAQYGRTNVTLLLNRIDENVFKPGAFSRVPADLCGYSNRIVSIGRLSDSFKNTSTLIKAMKHVIERHPDSVLVLIGEGIDRPRYQEIVDTLRLHDHVRLIGNQPQETVVDYLNWCDFFAQVNPYGDLGRPYAEAMMVGKPVVATGGKGNSADHLVDGFNAKMVPCGDIFTPRCVASALEYMIQHKGAFDPQAIRERAIRDYGFERLSRLEASIYDHVLTACPRPSHLRLLPPLHKRDYWRFLGLISRWIVLPDCARVVKAALRRVKPLRPRLMLRTESS